MIKKITDEKAFDIRYSENSDITHIRKWLQTKGMLSNFPMGNEKEIEMNLRYWSGFFRYHSSLTSTYNGVPNGVATLFLMPFRKVMHFGMMQFIVDPKWQRRGIGTALIKNIKHLAVTKFKLERLYFDVFEGSFSHSFLLKNGFIEICRQEKFVKENGKYKSRIIMDITL